MPDWAKQERGRDLRWLGENLQIFWLAAQKGFQETGRGAIVVDTTSRPTGAGHPFIYLPAAGVATLDSDDTLRMIQVYDPTCEFVAMLLKVYGRSSSYRVALPFLKKSSSSKA